MAENSIHRIYHTISMIFWVPHYGTMSAVLNFYQTMTEARTALESSSFAESVWSMGGINITYLAVTPKYLSTTPEIVPGCQTLGEAIILCWQQIELYCCTPGVWIWKVWLILARHLTNTAKQEQFPSLTVLVCTKLTWCWSLLPCQVLR